MRTHALFFVLSSILLFGAFHGTFQPRRSPRSPLTNALPGLPHGRDTASALWVAMVTGDANPLRPADKRMYFELGLGHLFTPSGVHLAVLAPLLKWIPWSASVYWIMGLFGGFIPGLLPLSRVCWLKAFPTQKASLLGFTLILCLEGMLRSWTASPMSWVCSWLFLGLSYFAPKRTRWAWFIVAQLQLNWIFARPVSLFILPAGVLIGIPLALFFPLLLGASFVPWFFVHDWILGGLQLLHDGVLWFHHLHEWVPPLMPHFGHLLFGVLLIALPILWKTRTCALVLLLLAGPLGPVQIDETTPSRWEVTPLGTAHLLIAQYDLNGVRTRWSDGTKCRHELVLGLWRENCRAQKARQRVNRSRRLSFAR